MLELSNDIQNHTTLQHVMEDSLVDGELEVWGLGPLANLTRSTSQKADDRVRDQVSEDNHAGNLLSLEEDDDQVEQLREIEQNKEATKPV